MPRRKNWRRSEARKSVLEKSSNYETRLTPESTHNVMLTESVMTKGNFEASPVSVQARSPVSVQAQSPVSVQAQTRNKHSKYNLKNKDVQTKLQNKDENKDVQTKLQNKDENKDCQTKLQNKDENKDVQTKLQNKDENKDCQTKLQNKDENKDCPTNLRNKDCEKNMTEKYCQMSSQSTNHNSFLHSSGTSTFSDILTKTKGPCLTGLENGSQPCQQFQFSTLSEVDTTKSTCVSKSVSDSILPSSSNHCFDRFKPFHSQAFICGSFHQGSSRFSVESRGSQCVSNALCALIYAQFSNARSSIQLDQILIEGDILYKKILSSLKAEQKYTSRLLTFDEIPENVNVFERNVHIMKSDVVSGIAIQDFGNMTSPTLHQSMHSAFQSSSCVLVMIGAICSAVYKKDGKYNFFDSHSHAQTGLSSCNGYSVLIRFSCLDDMITYMYALYESMQINLTTQYDLLPIVLTYTENFHVSMDQIDGMTYQKQPLSQSHSVGLSSDSLAVDKTSQYDFISETMSAGEYRVTDHSESLLANYFEEQNVKQQKKAEDIAHEINMHKYYYDNKRRKKRTEYYTAFKRKQRSKAAFKVKEKTYQLASKQSARKKPGILAQECAKKQSARQNQAFKEKERVSKQSARKNPAFKEKERVNELTSKQLARKKPGVLAQECAKKQSARQNPAFKEKERVYELASKQLVRKKPGVLAQECAQKQLARKKPGVLAQECAKKQSARQNPAFKEKERVYELASKQLARKKPGVLAQECAQKQLARKKPGVLAQECAKKQSARQNPAFKEKERVHELASKQLARNKPSVLAQECAKKQSARQNPAFKEKERVYELASKRSSRKNVAVLAKEQAEKKSARKKPGVLAKELAQKQTSRQDPNFKEKEKIYQLASKRKQRQKPFFLECERISQQERRYEKGKLEDRLELNRKNKKQKIADGKSHEMEPWEVHNRKMHQSVEECLKQFHDNIAVGPLFVCTCCHQTWFRKSVSVLKNTNIVTSSLNYCTKLKSVNNEEWICHTCLSALKDHKVPKLSVANGMKWPNKPPELDLHQLEESLIGLRIPFMQIRELPRGGQYSLKGNVINVPVDIQPTVNSLPRPMDENFTIAIQLKKKVSYKKIDFKENVRPMRVLTA